MGLKSKILNALYQELKPEYARLVDDDGISGFVVTRQFEDINPLDRQEILAAILSKALTKEERRRVLMIAGLTPIEYDSVGVRIRIHRVKEKAGGALEILLHGGPSDAQYVQKALHEAEGIQTTKPKQILGLPGVLMSFRAKGNEATPLTKEKALRVLRKDPYIEVMPKA